jgi:hypothetical protein
MSGRNIKLGAKNEIGFMEIDFDCLLELLRESLSACKVIDSLAENVVFLCALRKSWVLCDGVLVM